MPRFADCSYRLSRLQASIAVEVLPLNMSLVSGGVVLLRIHFMAQALLSSLHIAQKSFETTPQQPS